MNRHFENIVLSATGATALTSEAVIQTLWSGYGEIVRVALSGAALQSVVLKTIVLPTQAEHPRGWGGARSHARKIKSYDVEMHWYRDWSRRCGALCRVPACYVADANAQERVIVLEDLDAAGFALRKSSLNKGEAKLCLRWLAHFHATFLGEVPTGLWPIGCYWHLETRPDELAAMDDGALKQAAASIDARLNRCQYQTLVHGDAKVANFCFSDDGRDVAAVDFQYVGAGCGMKDVVYFLGSCLSEQQCERWEAELLASYFDALRAALVAGGSSQFKKAPLDWDALHTEWREMYPFAWADFHRFLMGWLPTHWKINSYSERLVAQVISQLGLDL